ncbi:MAG: hypothetical protein ACT443_14260 [Gemmatimonadota bacterium]
MLPCKPSPEPSIPLMRPAPHAPERSIALLTDLYELTMINAY